MADSSLLTEDQILFLANRPNYKTDAACAESLGFSKRTPNMWKHKILLEDDEGRRQFHKGEKVYDEEGQAVKPFLEAYTEVMNAARAVIDNPAEFIADVLLPKAVARKNEILNIRITPQTPAAMVSAINTAADSVMKAGGLMEPDRENDLRVTLVVADAIKAGATYQAPWMRQSALPPEVDPVRRIAVSNEKPSQSGSLETPDPKPRNRLQTQDLEEGNPVETPDPFSELSSD